MSISVNPLTLISVDLLPILSLITLILLFTLIVLREILSGMVDARAHRLQQRLSIMLVPLIVVFATISFARLLDILH